MQGALFAFLTALYAALIWGAREGASGALNGRVSWRVRSVVPPFLLLLCLPSGCDSARFNSLRLNVTALVAELDARPMATAAGPPIWW
jgi:hypothetical protein